MMSLHRLLHQIGILLVLGVAHMQVLCSLCQFSGESAPSASGEVICPGCGSTIRSDVGSTAGWRSLDERRRIGRFELLDPVGTGAFSTVYEARDTELDRVVAIKVPRADRVAGKPEEIERFLREARSVAQFHHPSIISIHDVGQQDGAPYLVEDFVRGITLSDLLTSERLAPRVAAELAAQVADALQYAHERGVIHRDVKPSNIMLERSGNGEYVPKIMDFGLAKRETGEETLTIEGQVLGTPAYMSPEQARGEGHQVDGRSDVYSLGVVLYQLLTGQMPFKGNARMLMHHVLHDEPKPPRTLEPKIPTDLNTICLRAMAKQPQSRYQSAGELRDDLRHWLAGEPIKARPVGRVERTLKWVRRRPEVAALVGVIILLIAGFVAAVAAWKREPGKEAKKSEVPPVAEVQASDVEHLFNAMVKPLMKIDCVASGDEPMYLGRNLIPPSLLETPGPDGKPRFYNGALYFSVSGTGGGHVLDLTDQPGQAGQITHFGGDISVRGPYLFFLGNLTPSARVYIKGGIGYSILAPMNGGLGSKHIEFDGTHLLMPKLELPDAAITDATEAERALLRNPDLVQKANWKYAKTEYVIFIRPGTKIVPGDHELRKVQYPEIYELIELDRKRQMDAKYISNARLQEALRKR